MPASSHDAMMAALDALQQQGTPAHRTSAPTPRRRRRVQRWVLGLAVAVVLAVLPFLLLVRLATLGYLSGGLGTWGALGAGLLVTTGLLWSYAAFASWRLRWLRGSLGGAARVLAALMLVYAGYTLLYLDAGHFKQAEEQATYTALHPLLRLALSTLTHLDGDLVITDTERRRADYARMGLPVLESSLHFRQADGYAHAVDLRTRGRAAWENTLIAAYFQAMGFRTLRHVGTADHLHVSLPVAGR